jgi:hypothetical protein
MTERFRATAAFNTNRGLPKKNRLSRGSNIGSGGMPHFQCGGPTLLTSAVRGRLVGPDRRRATPPADWKSIFRTARRTD